MSRREGVKGSGSQICYLQLLLMMMMVIMLEIMWREGGEGKGSKGMDVDKEGKCRQKGKNRTVKVLQLS